MPDNGQLSRSGHLNVSALYSDFAEAYECIADDRDFLAQAKSVSGLVRSAAPETKPRCVEIFAGPARHTLALSDLGWEVSAIDIAPQMRNIAVAAGFPSTAYHILDLTSPELDAVRPSNDLCLAMRYSIGHIARRDLPVLFGNIRAMMRSGGLLVIECHRISTLVGGAAELSIRERVGKTADGAVVRCRWPEAEIEWSPRSWTATMTIALSIARAGTATAEHYKFLSREEIHSADYLADAAIAAGFTEINDNSISSIFPESIVLLLEAV